MKKVNNWVSNANICRNSFARAMIMLIYTHIFALIINDLPCIRPSLWPGEFCKARFAQKKGGAHGHLLSQISEFSSATSPGSA
jgi:hypothetical protein